MNWIDIKQTRPKHDQKVLITNGQIVTAARADMDIYFDDEICWDSCGWTGYEWDWDWNNSQKIDITHWMPLPEPPQPASFGI